MAKKGLILMNLGSPDSTSVKDLRKYLSEFLMDERVIDKPYLLRYLLVKGIIVPFRAPKSAEAYQQIWWKEGSPLVVLTQQLKEKVAAKTDMPVAISMRYGNPSPQAAYEELLAQCPDLEEVILFPLYPHYAMSSYETAVEHMVQAKKELKYKFKLSVVPPFYNHPAYIEALANSMRPHVADTTTYDQLLFSYHGIPERHVIKTDPTQQHCMKVENCCTTPSTSHKTCYRHQVSITSELVAQKLGLPKDKWQQSYQSRLGRDPWLLPSTQTVIPEMPALGIKKLKVVCPSFVSDCLETLEEIEMRGKEDFVHNGGEQYDYIPCMNTADDWVAAVITLAGTAV
ncbi:ferrochelatase [Taibaiella sp. KBW10]|uniref:ferrochelatase n=1 Tax=Taibaiella sp. KBW10 TaxID=2153357 RepID=UPI000F5B1301|nr:ferrochelatase [Taibaiella sp. KBW10]RQO29982.1 ferrochelatase [Taibaiella sp. KBW10]